jgi:hypothetical protein
LSPARPAKRAPSARFFARAPGNLVARARAEFRGLRRLSGAARRSCRLCRPGYREDRPALCPGLRTQTQSKRVTCHSLARCAKVSADAAFACRRCRVQARRGRARACQRASRPQRVSAAPPPQRAVVCVVPWRRMLHRSQLMTAARERALAASLRRRPTRCLRLSALPDALARCGGRFIALVPPARAGARGAEAHALAAARRPHALRCLGEATLAPACCSCCMRAEAATVVRCMELETRVCACRVSERGAT